VVKLLLPRVRGQAGQLESVLIVSKTKFLIIRIGFSGIRMAVDLQRDDIDEFFIRSQRRTWK